MFKAIPSAVVAVLLMAASVSAADKAPPPNVLLIVADDLGVDILDAYGLGTDRPRTPNIDLLARYGVVFENAWSSPVCSPARACIQTGRYGFRTGVGSTVPPSSTTDYALPLSEITIPEMLDSGTGGRYTHAAIGKWHLGNDTVGGDLSPNRAGYSHFAGSMENLNDYYNWTQVIDGKSRTCTTYAATEHVNQALQWVATAPEPWYVQVCFNTPHQPYHAPPSALHSVNLSGAGSPSQNPRPYYNAMVEAMDTEIGRLLAGLGTAKKNTTVIFIGDNGTTGSVILPPFNKLHGKLTLYDGGVNVPLIVAGSAVSAPGSRSQALVHAVDIHATVADLAGVDLSRRPPRQQVDGFSLRPFLKGRPTPSLHRTLISEKFLPNGSVNGLLPEPLVNGCQPNLGYKGPGSVELQVCGGALNLAQRGVLSVTGAPPLEWGFMVSSNQFNPTAMFGGYLTPYPWLGATLLVSDARGELKLSGLGSGPLLRDEIIYLQMLMHDPAQSQSFALSNTVAAHFLPISVKAIRDGRYKLIMRIDEGQPDEFFDLWTDPFEANDLLAVGLTSNQLAHYEALLDELMASISSGVSDLR